MTGKVNTVQTVIVPNILRFRHGSGKLAVPLTPARAVSTHFRHITAVPTLKAGSSVPMYKLRILDNLIEQLSGKKGKGEDIVRISKGNIDGLISAFKREIDIRSPGGFFTGGYSTPDTGLLLDVFA